MEPRASIEIAAGDSGPGVTADRDHQPSRMMGARYSRPHAAPVDFVAGGGTLRHQMATGRVGESIFPGLPPAVFTVTTASGEEPLSSPTIVTS